MRDGNSLTDARYLNRLIDLFHCVPEIYLVFDHNFMCGTQSLCNGQGAYSEHSALGGGIGVPGVPRKKSRISGTSKK